MGEEVEELSGKETAMKAELDAYKKKEKDTQHIVGELSLMWNK